MKKTVIAVALSLALVAMIAVPVMAAAQKANLVPCPINYPAGSTLPPGGVFVVFNTSAGPNNLEVTVALKGVLPNTDYDIWGGVDSWDAQHTAKVGTVTTNGQGNANFHLNTAVNAPGQQHTLNIDIVLKDSGADIYELPGIHDSPMGGVTMTFK